MLLLPKNESYKVNGQTAKEEKMTRERKIKVIASSENFDYPLKHVAFKTRKDLSGTQLRDTEPLHFKTALNIQFCCSSRRTPTCNSDLGTRLEVYTLSFPHSPSDFL